MKLAVITIEGKGIAEVWEKSLLALWEKGAENKTEYDKKSDPPSKDATMIMSINEPCSQPRIHLAFPGGMEDLEKYRQEIVFGVHDHWINPEEGKWTYTYHDRLFNYHLRENPRGTVNQVEKLIKKLSATPYSRRAQAITWIPFCDADAEDPPCLQRIWCRIIENEGKLFLMMNTHWRSRDAYRAAFMNLFGITELQKYIADEISKRINKKVEVGRYVDISDSYHIYGESFGDFKDRFLNLLSKRKFFDPEVSKSRTMRSDSEIALQGFQYGRKLLEMEKETGNKGVTY